MVRRISFARKTRNARDVLNVRAAAPIKITPRLAADSFFCELGESCDSGAGFDCETGAVDSTGRAFWRGSVCVWKAFEMLESLERLGSGSALCISIEVAEMDREETKAVWARATTRGARTRLVSIFVRFCERAEGFRQACEAV